jgi:uncharacterized tellurite resistance protein B-like protein
MYQNTVATQEQALSHLFFHCCFKDGTFKDAELKNISDKLVTAGLHADLNFKEEVIAYQSYRNEITDEKDYLQFLIQLIRPTNELALFSYCLELCLSDSLLDSTEESLLTNLAAVLEIEEAEKNTTQKLMVQRNIVENQKLY